jgi:formiminoglutamase
MLKGASKAINKSINCINIDPHADLRKPEGRHSGNGFSYALKEKYLDHYFVLGLHENYNSQFILDQFKSSKKLNFYSFEEWLKGNIIWEECFEEIFNQAGSKPFGLEFDLDSIADFPTSAATPSGFSANDARIMINHLASNFDLKYFHLAEGSPELLPGKADLAAKLVAYMITDYVKSRTVA